MTTFAPTPAEGIPCPTFTVTVTTPKASTVMAVIVLIVAGLVRVDESANS